jgi:hypothetical protein
MHAHDSHNLRPCSRRVFLCGLCASALKRCLKSENQDLCARNTIGNRTAKSRERRVSGTSGKRKPRAISRAFSSSTGLPLLSPTTMLRMNPPAAYRTSICVVAPPSLVLSAVRTCEPTFSTSCANCASAPSDALLLGAAATVVGTDADGLLAELSGLAVPAGVAGGVAVVPDGSDLGCADEVAGELECSDFGGLGGAAEALAGASFFASFASDGSALAIFGSTGEAGVPAAAVEDGGVAAAGGPAALSFFAS